MKTLTYRGATYTPSKPAKREGAVEMTYRGIRHLLHPTRVAKPRATDDMVYRGVTYRNGLKGPIVLQKATNFVLAVGAALSA